MTWPALPVPDGPVSPIAPRRPVMVEDVVGAEALIDRLIDQKLKAAIGDAVRFDSTVEIANLALTTSFQTAASMSFTKPAGWNKYKAHIWVACMVAGVTAGDDIRITPQASGESANATDNAQSTSRFVIEFLELADETEDLAINNRIANITASRGAAYTSWIWLWAVRTA